MKISNTLTYGLLIFAGLVIYFLALAAAGLHVNPIYSLGNGLIVALGIYLMYKSFISNQEENKIEYYTGFSMGFITGMNAVVAFVIFFVIYAEEIQPDYMTQLISNWKTHYHTSDALVFFGVFVTGMTTVIVSTLCFMQYFKRSWNSKISERNQEIVMGE